jgi:hypothetical protein
MKSSISSIFPCNIRKIRTNTSTTTKEITIYTGIRNTTTPSTASQPLTGTKYQRDIRTSDNFNTYNKSVDHLAFRPADAIVPSVILVSIEGEPFAIPATAPDVTTFPQVRNILFYEDTDTTYTSPLVTLFGNTADPQATCQMCVDGNNNIYFIGMRNVAPFTYKLYRANREKLTFDASTRERYLCTTLSTDITTYMTTSSTNTTPSVINGLGPIAYDPLGFIWVGHMTNKTLYRYSATTAGTGTAYTAGGFTQNITSLATDSQGNIWVATGAGPIYRLTPNVSIASVTIRAIYWNETYRVTTTTLGDAYYNAKYGSVKGIAFDRNGTLYITDDTFHQIVQFPYACPPFPVGNGYPATSESGFSDIQLGSYATATAPPNLLLGGPFA